VKGCQKGIKPILAAATHCNKKAIGLTQNQFTAKSKVQGAKDTNVHKSVMPVHTDVNKNTITLLLNRGVDWINFKLSGNLFHK